MKLLVILASLVSVTAFGLRSESTTTQVDPTVQICSGTAAHIGNTRSEDQSQTVREKTSVTNPKVALIKGVPVGFKGKAYVHFCKKGGVSVSKPVDAQESRQNKRD